MRRRNLAWLLLVGSGALAGGCVGGSKETKPESDEALKAFILDAPPADVGTKVGINFDNKVTLIGAKVSPEGTARPGQRLKVTMYWKSEQALSEKDWKLFTHVLDGSGERILNIDNVGPLRRVKGSSQALAPSKWQPGKVYVDEQTFTLPRKLRTSTAQIVVGIWRGNDRLPIVAGPHDRQNRGIVATLQTDTTGAAPEKPASTRVPALRVDKLEAGEKIVIDGKLDEPAWERAPTTGPFVDVRTGRKNTSFPVNGSAKLLWDDKAMYVAFEVKDEDVVGGFDPKQKDPHLWTKDAVEIMIDPDGDGDNQDYYEIQINPQNLVFDSQFDSYNTPKTEPDGPFGHQQWSANLKSAVQIQGTLDKSDDKDEGYIVEAMIPWKSFTKAKQVPPAIGDVWRMNFYAMQQNGGVAWSPILGQGNFHRASRFGRVTWAEKGWTPPLPEKKVAGKEGADPEKPEGANLEENAPASAPGAPATPAAATPPEKGKGEPGKRPPQLKR
jgi:hypothetical protein